MSCKHVERLHHRRSAWRLPRPKDDIVLETALHANADRILTGDHDLLSLGQFHTARIFTARAYLEE